MKLTYTIGAAAFIALAGCGGEREAAEPVAAEEGIGEGEALAPVAGEVEREGVVAGEAVEREGVVAGEAVEREGVAAVEGREREE